MAAEKLSVENARLREEKERLQEKLTVSEATASRITEGLARTIGEAEVFRRASGEYKLRLEALGVEGGSGATSKVEQRLLAATSDWRLAEQERIKFHDALKELLEASQAAVAQPSNETRRLLESRMHKSQELLALSESSGSGVLTLADGRIVNCNDELALVIMSIGSKQGVTSGMPFQVFRENRYIGSVKVVDVRERIAGAIIENLSSEKDRIKVGDRLKVAAQQ